MHIHMHSKSIRYKIGLGSNLSLLTKDCEADNTEENTLYRIQIQICYFSGLQKEILV